MVVTVADIGALAGDLEAEQHWLDVVVSGLASDVWSAPTPAAGWTVRHQIAHLAYFDHAAEVALTAPAEFAALRAAADLDPRGYGEDVLAPYLQLPAGELLARWRAGRSTLAAALRAAPPGARVPWYGPTMSVASMATARLMETWAHGQDVADAVGVTREPTMRLVHVARIACLARPYSYQVRGQEPPVREVRVELATPEGVRWCFGPEGAADKVTGQIAEFCLVLTRRRHLADTRLEATGALAVEWLSIGQAYAGEPGPGRQPGQFAAQLDD